MEGLGWVGSDHDHSRTVQFQFQDSDLGMMRYGDGSGLDDSVQCLTVSAVETEEEPLPRNLLMRLNSFDGVGIVGFEVGKMSGRVVGLE